VEKKHQRTHRGYKGASKHDARRGRERGRNSVTIVMVSLRQGTKVTLCRLQDNKNGGRTKLWETQERKLLVHKRKAGQEQ